jgi:hypothetical protein
MQRSTRLAIFALALAAVAGLAATVVWGPAILLLWTEPDSAPLPAANSAEAVELVLLAGPPLVEPQAELQTLHDDTKARCYFSFTLSADAGPAYFIATWSGAHRVGFAPVDCKGRLLVRPDDLDEIGGDRIDVVQSSHAGYHDLVCSDFDPGGADYTVWQFDGATYVKIKEGHLADKKEFQAFIDGECRGALAFWCSDIWSLPPGRFEAKLHPPAGK